MEGIERSDVGTLKWARAPGGEAIFMIGRYRTGCCSGWPQGGGVDHCRGRYRAAIITSGSASQSVMAEG